MPNAFNNMNNIYSNNMMLNNMNSINMNNNLNNNFQNNQMMNNILENKDKEILNLKNELNNARNIIEQQKIKIHNLQNQLNNYSNYQNIINQKDKELNNLKSELNNLKLELQNIKSQNKKYVDINKMMTVNFISMDQHIHFAIPCIGTDTFAEVEEKLYKKFPEYRETNNNFLAYGEPVLRFKTITQNKIGDGLPVTMIIP